MRKSNDNAAYPAEQAAAHRAANADFPLFWHQAGGWTKKIRGRFVYFGKVHPDAAWTRYTAERVYLERGEAPPPPDANGAKTLLDLCNAFLESKRALVTTGELTEKSWKDYHRTCGLLIEHLGRWRSVASLSLDDLRRLRVGLATGRLSRTRSTGRASSSGSPTSRG
jgi:hypothetical protein